MPYLLVKELHKYLIKYPPNFKVQVEYFYYVIHYLTKMQIQHKKLQYKTRKINDVNLDTLVIPHPLMGKMTVRELIMWAAYHTEHHTTILKKLYSGTQKW